MKKIILTFFILFLIYGTADAAPERVPDSYLGGSLIFSSARLNSPETRSWGFGAEFFYQSFVSPSFSYNLNLGFLYNSFSPECRESIFYPTTGVTELVYTRDEGFYSFSPGFLFSYSRLSGNFRPYLSSGLICSFIYKTYHYSYTGDPGSFINTEKQSRWLPAALLFPLTLGTHFFLDAKNLLNLSVSYVIPFWDRTVENYGYGSIFQVRLGYLRRVPFRL